MVPRKLLYIGNSWELILPINIGYPRIVSYKALNNDTFLQLTTHSVGFCIDVETGVEFGDVLPYIFQCQYLRNNNHPVLAINKSYYDNEKRLVREISQKMELHGYKQFYWVVHNESDARFEVYRDGHHSAELKSVVDRLVVVEYCNSLSQLPDSIHALEKRWADLFSGLNETTVYADELLWKNSQLHYYAFWYESASRELQVMTEQLKKLQTGSRAEELQKHYDEVYESLPQWHKKLGSLLRRCRKMFKYGRK